MDINGMFQPLDKSADFQAEKRRRCLYLSPWSTVLPEKQPNPQLLQKISDLQDPKVYFSIQKRPPPIPIPSKFERFHAPTSLFSKINFYIILQLKPWPSKWCPSLRFTTDSICAPLLPHTCFRFRPSHLNYFEHSYYILCDRGIQRCELQA